MTEAVFGLIGVLIGVFSTWGQSWWSESRSTGRAAHYLAVRVVCVLDQYVERCAEVVSDDGLSFGQRNPDGCLEPQVPLPGPPMFPEDVDWKSIGHDLMYRLLSMPAEVEEADQAIGFVRSVVAFPPDYDEFFEERSYQYGQIGLKASALADELRKIYSIPQRELGDWNPLEKLSEAIKEVEETRQKRADSTRVLMSGLEDE